MSHQLDVRRHPMGDVEKQDRGTLYSHDGRYHKIDEQIGVGHCRHEHGGVEQLQASKGKHLSCERA